MPENKSDFSPDSYLEKLYQNNKAEFHFAAETKAEWEQWRQRLKEKIAEIIGGLPGILRAAELPTIISALAPVPLLIQAAEKDSLFPLDSAEKGFQEIKNVYNFLNQQERLKFNLLQGAEHSVEAAPIIEFLNELN